MTSAEDLKKALFTNLERSGQLKRLKADILQSVFTALGKSNGCSVEKADPYSKGSPVSDCKFIILELIMEFLGFESLDISRSVLRAESGHGHLNIARQTLCQVLGIRPTVNVKSLVTGSAQQTRLDESRTAQVSRPVPILYYLVNWFRTRANELDTPAILNPLDISRACPPEMSWEKMDSWKIKSSELDLADRPASSSSDSESSPLDAVKDYALANKNCSLAHRTGFMM